MRNSLLNENCFPQYPEMRGIYISVQLFPIRAPYSTDNRLSDVFPNSLRHSVQYHATTRKYMPVQKINLYNVMQCFYRLRLQTGNDLPMLPDWILTLPLMPILRSECSTPFLTFKRTGLVNKTPSPFIMKYLQTNQQSPA